MFETVLYADIGSANTKLSLGSEVLCEPTRAALDPQNGSRVLAVGESCRRLLNAVEVYPVRRGSIANPGLTAVLLKRLSSRLLRRRPLFGTELRLLMPQCSPQLNRIAAAETARAAGFRRVRLVDSLLFGAIGAGVDVDSPRAVMIADIGRDVTSAAVVCNGGSLCQSRAHFGSADIDRAIRQFYAEEHGLLVSAEHAESIKMSMDRSAVAASGRSAGDGSLKKLRLRTSALDAALQPVYRALASELTEALNMTPPDAAADICDTGIVLIGGGACQHGICEALSGMLGLPVRAAGNALTATVTGAGSCASLGISQRRLLRAMAQ